MQEMKVTYSRMLTITAIALLLAALIFQRYQGQQDTLKWLHEVLPDASVYEKIEGKQTVYKAFRIESNNDKKLIGYAALASAAGYGGPITVLVGIDPEGTVLKTVITDHVETPLFLRRVVANGFLDNFKGKLVSEPFQLNNDIDAISGATFSSRGIVDAVRQASHRVGISELGMQIIEPPQPWLHLEEILLAVIYSLVILGLWKNLKWMRTLTLVLSLAFLGFWQNSPITLANLATLFTGNAPSLLERPFWHLLVTGTLVITLLLGKNFYCYWLCPFGAIQEGLHKMGGFKYKPSPAAVAVAKKIRLPLVWLALMTALLFRNPSIASYEPFPALFKLQGNQAQWLLMPFVLFIGLFILRFWCRFFCPVGAVMDLTASLKKAVMRQWPVRKKPKISSSI